MTKILPLEAILAILAQRLNLPANELSAKHVGGGSIHQAICLQHRQQQWFLKYNHGSEAANFAAEAAGLEALAASKTLDCAKVLDRFEAEGQAFLLLEWLEQGRRTETFWESFGRGLAQLHRHSSKAFGWQQDNFIGRLPQYNAWKTDFADFFWSQRIAPRLKEARQLNLLNQAQAQQMEALCGRLSNWLPAEKPALLHGDLWSGNFLCQANGRACLIDPAVHFGHRESELAFTRLFGGFSETFYQAYQAEFPLSEGWEARIDLLNLYPLMVHLVLFGRSYLPDVLQILARFA